MKPWWKKGGCTFNSAAMLHAPAHTILDPGLLESLVTSDNLCMNQRVWTYNSLGSREERQHSKFLFNVRVRSTSLQMSGALVPSHSFPTGTSLEIQSDVN